MNKHNCRNALSSMMSSVTVACYGCDLGSLIGRNALSSMMSSVTQYSSRWRSACC